MHFGSVMLKRKIIGWWRRCLQAGWNYRETKAGKLELESIRVLDGS